MRAHVPRGCFDLAAMAHQSDSGVQLQAEAAIRTAVEQQLGVSLPPRRLQLPGGARVDVDGVDEASGTYVEIFAHQGPLKAAQFHKVARDALKLITIARDRPAGARLALAFASAQAARSVQGRSWLSEALRTWDVAVIVVDVDAAIRASVLEAQARQVMVNPALEPPEQSL